MAKSKSLIIGIIGLCVVVILIAVMIMRDNTQLLSAQEAQALLISGEVQEVSVDNDYVYFIAKDTPYKVYLYALSPKIWSYDFPISVKNTFVLSEILG